MLALEQSTPQQIDEAASANLVTHMGWVQGRTPGMQVNADQHLTLIDSGLPADTFNIVCGARLPDDTLRERIARVVAHFEAVGRPFAWWVGPADRPHSLGEALVEAGLEAAESEAAMAADLRSLQAKPGLKPAPAPEGLRIERARTPEQIRAFASVVAANWTPPDPAVYEFNERAMPVLLDPDCPLRLYVGFLGDEPVATSEVTVGGGVVGLYNVCTLEARRHRGFASALVGRCLLDARDQGFCTAVLQASEQGQGVYARLGFRVTGRFTEYKPVDL